MQVTPIGWILIPLGLVTLLARRRWLYALTVFFVPFSATTVVNTANGDSESGFSPYLFFGLLLVARESVNALSQLKLTAPRSTRTPAILLVAFTAICLLSLSMPFVISGRLYIMSGPTLEYSLVPLRYTYQTLNHALSLILDVAVTLLIAWRCTNSVYFYDTLRTYLISGVFVCTWGWMQFILYLVGFEYPAIVFNNNPSAYGYDVAFESLNIVRVSSVAIEPSFLSRILVAMAAICVMAVYTRTPIFSSTADKLLLCFLLTTTVITTASTGYVGLMVLLILLLFLPSRRIRARMWLGIGILATVGGVIGLYLLSPPVANVINSALLDKSSSGSVLERATIIYNDFQYFLQYPILGIGWDCAPTHDVIIGMLANCGVLGAAAFSILICTVISRIKKYASRLIGAQQTSGPVALMVLCLPITCVVYIISGGIEPPDFWLVLALSIAASGIGRELLEQVA